MQYYLALITQNRGLEKVIQRLSKRLGCSLRLYEGCGDFISDAPDNEQGVVVVDAAVCSQARLMDLQMVLSEASTWQVIYLPATPKKSEIKEAMTLGVFGCLHRPLNEREIQQMVQSAMAL